MHPNVREDIQTGTPGTGPEHRTHFKTPPHTLIRVRDNQRRHRQRRREYIASLEHRVQELEGLFAHAKAEVAALETKLDQCNGNRDHTLKEHAAASTPLALHSPDSPSTQHALHRTEPTVAAQYSQNATDGGDALSNSTTYEREQRLVTSSLSLDPNEAIAIRTATHFENVAALEHSITQPAKSFLPSPTSPKESFFHPCQSACPSQGHPLEAIPMPAPVGPLVQTLQPPELRPEEFSPSSPCCEDHEPADGAFTTSCTRAYILIAQQNFRGLDELSIKERLWRGFRKARDEKEGCRVENTVLFSLLDFIS